MSEQRRSLTTKFRHFLLAVPIRVKLAGIVMLPVLILGLSLNYWVRTGLSDWLSYILAEERIEVAMQVGSRSVILVTVLAAIASVLFASTLTFVFTRPILQLRKVALQVAGGELDSRARLAWWRRRGWTRSCGTGCYRRETPMPVTASRR